MTSAVAAVIGLLVLRGLLSLAGRARATTADGRSVYGVVWPGKILFLAAITILGGLPIIVLLQDDDWGAAMLLIPFFLLCLLALPGPIVVDRTAGISTRRWYGRAKHIGWNEIAMMDWSQDMQRTIVIGTGGQKIIHTGFHAARDEFRNRISALATPPGRA